MKEVFYNPNPSVISFHESTARVKALAGPVGSGKSSAAMWQFFMNAQESPIPLRGLVLRETYRQLTDTTKRTWEDWFEGCSDYKKQDEQLQLTIPGVDGVWRTHTLDLRHARRAADAQAFMSAEYGFIWLEEVTPAIDMATGIVGGGLPEELLDIALMRIRQKGAHRLEIILTFNPPPKFHWVFRRFYKSTAEELAAQGFALFQQPPFENRKNLPPNYYENLLQQLRSEELVQRFVNGLPVTIYPGVRVYPQILEDVHIVDAIDPIPGIALISMHDFGRTPCCILAQATPEGRLLCLKEIQLWDASVETFASVMADTLKEQFPGTRWSRGWGDPSGQYPHETDDKTAFGIMAAKGFPLLPGAMTFTARREAVIQRSERMIGGKPALMISRAGCPMLCEAVLGGYRYPKAADGQIGRTPIKNDFSHTGNALEYGCSGEYNIRDGSAVQRAGEESDTPVLPKFNPLDTSKKGGGSWMTT